MQNTTRTTIRIRTDLLNQSRLLAIHKGTSVQDVINATLATGFAHISDLQFSHEAMKKIDTFRQNMSKKKIDMKKLLESAKSQQK